MGELLRRGHIAALAPQGAPNMDVLIADESGQQLYSIQVKTRTFDGGDRGWHMGEKHEKIVADRLFYVFVDLGVPEGSPPQYFIIPSAVVAEIVRDSHVAWWRNPGKGGRERNKDSKMRRIRPDYSSVFTDEPVDDRMAVGWMDKYRSAWSQFVA